MIGEKPVGQTRFELFEYLIHTANRFSKNNPRPRPTTENFRGKGPLQIEDVDFHRLHLSDSVQSPDALLHHCRAPRKIVVHQMVGKLEVATFASYFRTNQNLGTVRISEPRYLSVALNQ